MKLGDRGRALALVLAAFAIGALLFRAAGRGPGSTPGAPSGAALPGASASAPASAAPATTASPIACGPGLGRAEIDEALDLGASFLVHAQKPEGNFTYLYEWKSRKVGRGDSSVRQAGALWGLTLLHRARPRPETAAAIDRALAFFEAQSHLTPDGRRYFNYPEEAEGTLGTVALVALAHLEHLASGSTRPHLREHLDQYLAMLLAAQRPDGSFSEAYDLDDGSPYGEPSPYYDGEALLALVEAARALGRDDLRAPALRAAERAHLDHVVNALKKDPLSASTRAFFQWGLLAEHALAGSGWPGTEVYADKALSLADWMLDVQRVDGKANNLGYAFEGLGAAYDLARRRGDTAREQKIRCALGDGLRRITTWQVGHSLAAPFLRAAPPDDLRARGGAQSREDSDRLRIDVTQHQMHALLLLKRYLPDE
ncbi:MAG: hypothetical protein U0359_22915 [Byssovorax sp.]